MQKSNYDDGLTPVAYEPLNGAQHNDAEMFLDFPLGNDGSTVREWLPEDLVIDLLDGDITPAEWLERFDTWRQDHVPESSSCSIEQACAHGLMFIIGAYVRRDSLSDNPIYWLNKACRKLAEMEETELKEKEYKKTKQQMEIRNLVMARKKVKAIQRIVGILDEFEEISNDPVECHHLQADVILFVKIMYRVKDEPSDTKRGRR